MTSSSEADDPQPRPRNLLSRPGRLWQCLLLLLLILLLSCLMLLPTVVPAQAETQSFGWVGCSETHPTVLIPIDYPHRMIAYTVIAIFDDARVANEWITWLREEHLVEVCAAGALDAEVIRLDSMDAQRAAVRCEVRYHFASREAFQAYERDHAPRLRADGLNRFPPERGIHYERSIGEVETSFG